MAFFTISERFSLPKVARAAAVVPFGLVTFSRYVVGLLPDSAKSFAEPIIV